MGITVSPFTLFQDAGIERRDRSLKYDLNAMADFEQLTGMGLAQLMSTNAIFAATRALLWAGLRHQDRGLTVERAGSLMQEYVQSDDSRSLQDVLEACLNACYDQKAIPNLKRPEGEDDPNGKSSSRQTGTQTGPGSVTSGPSSSTHTTSSDSAQTSSDS